MAHSSICCALVGWIPLSCMVSNLADYIWLPFTVTSHDRVVRYGHCYSDGQPHWLLFELVVCSCRVVTVGNTSNDVFINTTPCINTLPVLLYTLYH